MTSPRQAFEEKREKERDLEREREREREIKERQRPKIGGGGDIVATHITAATVPKARVTLPRSTFKKMKERERERERITDKTERDRKSSRNRLVATVLD